MLASAVHNLHHHTLTLTPDTSIYTGTYTIHIEIHTEVIKTILPRDSMLNTINFGRGTTQLKQRVYCTVILYLIVN